MGFCCVWVAATSLVGRPTRRSSGGSLFSLGLLCFRLGLGGQVVVALSFSLPEGAFCIFLVYFDVPFQALLI